jgi:DNA polymerase-3 subunit gamma/tau
MTYQVLFRKWRPQVFEEVVGQPFVVRTLQNALKSGKISHAYLFSGPRGVGKTTVARILAKALNCKEGLLGTPCNKCSSCREISLGISPDVQEIDGASNRGIEEIRNLRENVKFMPTLGLKRVFIIDEVHMLTIHAFNALLKTLEEPPRHVVFIFATTEPHKVPPTILSRCQRFDFKRIPVKDMTAHLQHVAEKEGIILEDGVIDLIVKKAEGSMRDAQGLLDQVVASSGEIVKYETVAELLGEIEAEFVSNMALALVKKDPATIFRTIKAVYEKGYDLREFYKTILELFKNSLLIQAGAAPEDLGLVPWQEEVIKEISLCVGLEEVSVMAGLMLKYHEFLRVTDDPKLISEIIFLRLGTFKELLPLSKLYQIIAQEGTYTGNQIGATRTHTEPTPEPLISPQQETQEKSGEAKDWESFLHFLKKKKEIMARSLSGWELISFHPKELVLKKPSHPVLKEYLDDSGRLKELKELWKEYFGEDVRIIIKDGEAGEKKKSTGLEELIKRFKAERLPNGAILRKDT